MSRATIIILLSVCAFLATAQGKVWTLDDCMRYAVENSPRTNKQQLQNRIYHQDYMEAIGQLLPSVNASTHAGFNFGRRIDDKTNTYNDINSFSNTYSISASLVLFDGLANYNRVRISKVNKLYGKQNLEAERDMVAYETMEVYFNVIYNRDLLQIAEEQLAETEANLTQVKRMEELGVKGYPDVVEIEAKQAEDLFYLTRQQNLLTIALILLKEKMNYPIEDDLYLVGDEKVASIEMLNEDALSIYNQTLLLNPKALGAESAYESQRLSYQASKGYMMPTLSMSAGMSTNFSRYMDGSPYQAFKDQLKNGRGEYIQFSLSIPLFNGFSRTSSVNRAKHRARIARMERDDVYRKLYSEVEQAVADVNGQVAEYNQAVKQKEAAQTAHQVNLRKYEEGLIDPIILHTSANRLMRAKAEELNARYKYQLKMKMIGYYKGESFITDEK